MFFLKKLIIQCTYSLPTWGIYMDRGEEGEREGEGEGRGRERDRERQRERERGEWCCNSE